jgi:hypothetical protein
MTLDEAMAALSRDQVSRRRGRKSLVRGNLVSRLRGNDEVGAGMTRAEIGKLIRDYS